ncbi:MAG: hypothetical protein KF805_04855 [Phycisphaeraceae bacterium]|nr:hypothetical protein [Phycisphaeraceae bacterium]
MLARSAIFRLLLALVLALGGPACLCAAGSAKPVSGSMASCDECCDCCKADNSGGCDSATPGERPADGKPHHDCSSVNLHAMAGPPDVSIAKTAVGAIPVVWGWGFLSAEQSSDTARITIHARRTIAQPTTSLLRQHCALTV